MPGLGTGGSTVAALVAKRAALSKVRQRIGLEGSNNAPQSTMTPAGPVGGPPPAAVVGPQVQAAMGQPPQTATAGPQGAPMGFQPVGDESQQTAPAPGEPLPSNQPPEQRQQMLSMVGQFLDKHGPQQQQMMDQQKQAQQPAPAQAGGDMQAALSPIAKFHQQTGRLPSPEELMVIGAQNRLRAQLGRDATPEEIQQYLSPQATVNKE